MKKRRKQRIFTKKFKIFVSAILLIAGFIYFNQGKEEYLAFSDNLKSKQKEYIIDNIKAVNQMPEYPTGCESVSLYILLKHYDVDVTIDDIIEKLPKGSVPYEEDEKMFGPNPEEEFVGDPYTEYSYGVFEEPIKKVANKFKKGAISSSNFKVTDIKKIIESGNPLIAWVRTNEDLSKVEYSDSWISEKDGVKVKWPKGEHAVVVYGYDEDYYYISNPYNGEKYPLEKEIFEYNFEAMGQRVVYYND